jgi:thiol-disulfide isomerase/thioredoxin
MRRTLITATAMSLCFAGLVHAGDEEPAKTLSIGDKAPAIDIEHWLKGVEMDRRGNFTPITEFEDGKVYVLEFWATWCGPCIASMPHLSKLQEQYKDYDVTVIGISDESLPKVTNFLFQTYKRDGKLQNDRTQYTLTTDPDESVKNDYFRAAGRTGIPCSFIIGKEGHVEWIGHPMSMDDPLDAIVRDTWDRDEFRVNYQNEMAAKLALQAQQKKMRAAYESADWDTYFAILDEALAKNPKDMNTLYQKFNTQLTVAKRPADAYETGAMILELGWDNSGMLNAIAWTVVDNDGVTDRNLDFALKAATRANELTESKDPAILDTLARVHFEHGNIEKAVKFQKMAVEYAGDDEMGADIRKTLEKYEQAPK